MKTFITYKRVSTEEQAKSGLGVEAQERSIQSYVKEHGVIIAEYQDLGISGKSDNRPGLIKAIRHAKKTQSSLIVQKLDRLSRSMQYVVNFLENKSNPTLICAESPNDDTLMLHIKATLAQNEREVIAARTKAGLQSARERGIKLGGRVPGGNYHNLSEDDKLKGIKKRQSKALERLELWREEIQDAVSNINEGVLNWQSAAEHLSSMGMKSARGSVINKGTLHKNAKMLGII